MLVYIYLLYFGAANVQAKMSMQVLKYKIKKLKLCRVMDICLFLRKI